jgi:hypothetical protein
MTGGLFQARYPLSYNALTQEFKPRVILNGLTQAQTWAKPRIR